MNHNNPEITNRAENAEIQGMNLVAGGLLSLMDEEDAFWALVCQTKLPILSIAFEFTSTLITGLRYREPDRVLHKVHGRLEIDNPRSNSKHNYIKRLHKKSNPSPKQALTQIVTLGLLVDQHVLDSLFSFYLPEVTE
eukprot:1118750-Amorphochlora_amoeboformis.AAC.1